MNRPENKREKEQISVSGQIKSENKYYLKISGRYRVAAFILLAALIIFVAVMFIRYGSSITYDNLIYLFRNADSMVGGERGIITELSYNAQENMTFISFGDGVAIAGSTDIKIYDPSGSATLTENAGYAMPVMTSGDKYLLVFDMGTKNYSVFNSLIKVRAKEADYEIVGADMSDTGAFILLTKSKNGKFDVEVYGDSLERVMKIHKDKYVVDAAISSDGKRVAVLSAVEGDLELGYELYVCRVGESDPIFSKQYDSASPLRLDFNSAGNLSVVTDGMITFYDKDLKEIGTTGFSGMTPSYFDASEYGVIIACAENAIGNKNKVMTFDTGGKIIYNDVIQSRISGVAAIDSPDGNAVGFVRTGESVIELHGDGSVRELKCPGDVIKIIGAGDGVLAFTPVGAKRLEGNGQ